MKHFNAVMDERMGTYIRSLPLVSVWGEEKPHDLFTIE
jgi:hypothetical protein